MPTLVVYGGTVLIATASVYYLLQLASAKRDADPKGELAVHNSCRLDGVFPFFVQTIHSLNSCFVSLS